MEQAGSLKTRLYETARQILDDLEDAAPWAELYYPSQDSKLLACAKALIGIIDQIPQRIRTLTEGLQTGELDEAQQRLVDNCDFFFEGIHGSVMPDIARLRSKLKSLSAASELSSDQRDFTCEITADLKGKYASSMMGATASLIADGLWNGVEIEPILFPEKAEEFERNRLLVETLNEVIENINHLLEEVPLAGMVERWGKDERVDLYALTPLYSFLGNLGKLMKEDTRRALYSGDYHQIRKRERLLNARINELTTLHNLTWTSDEKTPALPEGGSPYPAMIQKATELSAILDVNILKQIIGEKYVKDLLFIVTIEKDRARDRGEERGMSSMRSSLPENFHPLIPLLYDDDLQNFLGFLLGSVLKRASLTLKHEPIETEAETDSEVAEVDIDTETDAAVEEPQPQEPSETEELLPRLSEFGFDDYIPEAEPETTVAPPAEDGVSAAEKLSAVRELHDLLQGLLARSNPHRKSFELVYRLLDQRKTVPSSMLQSMQPYLYDMMNMLIPQLNELERISDISPEHATKLFDYCTFLCDRHLTQDQIRGEVPVTMKRLLRLLDGLQSLTAQILREMLEE